MIDIDQKIVPDPAATASRIIVNNLEIMSMTNTIVKVYTILNADSYRDYRGKEKSPKYKSYKEKEYKDHK